MACERGSTLVGITALVLLAGCGAFFGGGPSAAESTITPAPVPDGTETPAANVGPTSRNYWGNVTAPTNSSTVTQPRVLALRPNCRRPPGTVIHLQVLALGNNDPATNEGINTTWRFAAPSNRDATGPYPNFVRTIKRGFEPLLNASAVRYGPLDRSGDTASQRVTVYDVNGTATNYDWRVEKQDSAPYEGCWMTTGVVVRPTERR